MSTKSAKAEAIAKCIGMAAAYFQTTPERILGVHFHGNDNQDARHLLWHHFHACGMSYETIAKMFGRAVPGVQRGARQGVIRMMGEDRQLLESMPKIPNRCAPSLSAQP